MAALPITTMLVLLLGRMDAVPIGDQARFAKSLLLGIPLVSTFLLPFVAAPRLGRSFWPAFGAELVLLAIGYAVHRSVLGI